MTLRDMIKTLQDHAISNPSLLDREVYVDDLVEIRDIFCITVEDEYVSGEGLDTIYRDVVSINLSAS